MPLFNLHLIVFIYFFETPFISLVFWHSQIAIKFPFNSSHTSSWRAFSFRVELLHVAFGTLPRRVASDSYSDSDSHIPIGIILSAREHFCYMLWLLGLVLEPSRRRRPRQIFPVGPLLLSFFLCFGFVNFPQRIFVDARTVTIFHKLSTG